MRIGTLARRLGATPPGRGGNRYREYTEADAERLRLLIGLRQLDIPLDQAADLASMCAAGRCDEVSDELRSLLAEKRQELARRMEEMRFLDRRMAHLAGQLAGGAAPRRLINLGKEDDHAPAV